MKQLALELARPAEPTLENFVPGANTELVDTLRALARRTLAERFVYLWGAGGSGRTHLLAGVAAAWCGDPRPAVLACARGVALPDDLGARTCVLADDVDRLDADAQIALFHAYNAIRAGGGTLVASGGEPPARLGMRADLATRLAWGLVFEVRPLTDEERHDALARHAAARGFSLAPDVARFLLARVQRDMGSLLAIIDALDRHSLETKRAVTVPLVRDWLRTHEGARSRARAATPAVPR